LRCGRSASCPRYPPQFEVNFLNPNLVAPCASLLNCVADAFESDPRRHDCTCRNPYRQSGRIRFRDRTNPGFRTSCGDRPGTRRRLDNLGRPVRSEPGITDRNPPSRRAGNDCLRPLRCLLDTLGCEGRICSAREGWRFHSCPRLSAAYGNQPFENGAVSMGCRAEHGDAHCHQPSGRHLAVSRMSSSGQQEATWP